MKYKMKISFELFDKNGGYVAPKESNSRTIEAESDEAALKAKNLCWHEAICAVYNELARQGRDRELVCVHMSDIQALLEDDGHSQDRHSGNAKKRSQEDERKKIVRQRRKC